MATNDLEAEPLLYESLGGGVGSPPAQRGLRFSLSRQWSNSSGGSSSDTATPQLLHASSSYTDLHSLARPAGTSDARNEEPAKKNELGTINVRRLCIRTRDRLTVHS